MKNTILIIALCLSVQGLSQIDYAQHNQYLIDANRAFEKSEYETALQWYEKAFNLNGAHRAAEYSNAAICSAHLGNKQGCKKWVTEVIIRKNTDTTFLREASDLKSYQESYQEVMNNYGQLQKQYYDGIENLAVFSEIQKLVSRDQEVRKIGDYYLGVSEADQEEAFLKLSDPEVKKRIPLWSKNTGTFYFLK